MLIIVLGIVTHDVTLNFYNIPGVGVPTTSKWHLSPPMPWWLWLGKNVSCRRRNQMLLIFYWIFGIWLILLRYFLSHPPALVFKIMPYKNMNLPKMYLQSNGKNVGLYWSSHTHFINWLLCNPKKGTYRRNFLCLGFSIKRSGRPYLLLLIS